MKSKGSIACRAGRRFEDEVAAALRGRGFTLLPHKLWKKAGEPCDGRVLVRDQPYVNVFGYKSKTEFLAVSGADGARVRIECKYQRASGSVEDKFGILVENIKKRMPEREIVVIVDGGGARPGAVRWLKDSAAKIGTKTVLIVDFNGFLKWARKRFPAAQTSRARRSGRRGSSARRLIQKDRRHA